MVTLLLSPLLLQARRLRPSCRPIPKFLQVNPRVLHRRPAASRGVSRSSRLMASSPCSTCVSRASTARPTSRRPSKAAGLKYFNIPVVYRDPTDAEVDAFLKITDDPANRPMFIHCTAAIRVGAFWAIRRAVRDGLTADAALEEGAQGRPDQRAAPRRVRAQVHRVPSAQEVAMRRGSRPVQTLAAALLPRP